jgi:Notch-like protein
LPCPLGLFDSFCTSTTNAVACMVSNTGVTCTCATGFSGQKCEIAPALTCNPNPCQNNGFCNVIANALTCFCVGPFTGTLCESPLVG